MSDVTYADSSGLPEDERMTPAEFRVVREYLGLTSDWLAEHLRVTPRTVRYWEQGKYPIPDGVRLAIESLERETTEFVDAIVENLLASNDADLAVITYRDDAEYRAVHPHLKWPARWHRAVVARVIQKVPNLAIVYAPATVGSPA